MQHDSSATANRTSSELESGARIFTRTVVIAIGAQDRKLTTRKFVTHRRRCVLRCDLCGSAVMWKRGGNSAGQAAVFLAQTGNQSCR